MHARAVAIIDYVEIESLYVSDQYSTDVPSHVTRPPPPGVLVVSSTRAWCKLNSTSIPADNPEMAAAAQERQSVNQLTIDRRHAASALLCTHWYCSRKGGSRKWAK